VVLDAIRYGIVFGVAFRILAIGNAHPVGDHAMAAFFGVQGRIAFWAR
jgi:hypothetical protein